MSGKIESVVKEEFKVPKLIKDHAVNIDSKYCDLANYILETIEHIVCSDTTKGSLGLHYGKLIGIRLSFASVTNIVDRGENELFHNALQHVIQELPIYLGLVDREENMIDNKEDLLSTNPLVDINGNHIRLGDRVRKLLNKGFKEEP